MLLPSCENGGKIKYYPPIEEQNTGTLEIYCDESLKNIVKQQAEIFELEYPQAKILTVFLPERELMEKLLNGSARTAILARKLNDAEKTQISKVDSIKCREHFIAKTALVPITQKGNSLKLTLEELKKIFVDGSLNIILEGKKSDRLKAVSNALNINEFSKNIYAVNSLDSVWLYVNSSHKNIGLIEYSHISDEFSAETEMVYKNASLIKIETNCDGKIQTVTANPSDIFTNCYPLVTPVNYVVTDYRNKLSLGFVNFMVKSRAGRVFLHSGFIPAVMPQREIVIDTSGFSAKQNSN
jgi:phosphate transport system substrate-binding protein